MNDNAKDTPMEEGEEEKEEGELEEEPSKPKDAEQSSGLLKSFRIVAWYLPLGNCKHTLLLAEDRNEGKKESVYTWDVDSNYDPSSILDFELEYLKQDLKWPYRTHERMLQPSSSSAASTM